MAPEEAIILLKPRDKTSTGALSAVRIHCCSRDHVAHYIGCALYVRMTRGLAGARGDAHPLDMWGTSRTPPPPGAPAGAARR